MTPTTPTSEAANRSVHAVPALPSLTLLEIDEAAVPGLESYSPFCLKIHRALKLAQLPYQRRIGSRPSDHRRHNPTGQVPVLLIGSEAVPDSTRILRRLVALAPERLRAPGEAWLWEELGDTSLNGFLVAARWADEDNWPLVREAYFRAMPAPLRRVVPNLLRRRVLGSLIARDVWRAGADACWRRFDELLDELEARAPAAGFWLGSEITVADLGLFAQLHSLRTPLTRRQADAVARRGRLSAWLDRVDAATAGPAQT